MRGAMVLLLLVGACAAQPDPRLAEGRRLAEAQCASCHAVGPNGASPRPSAPAFRDLHRRYPVDQLAESLAEGIVTGHPAMPQTRFDQAEIEAFLVYLNSLAR